MWNTSKTFEILRLMLQPILKEFFNFDTHTGSFEKSWGVRLKHLWEEISLRIYLSFKTRSPS